MKNLLLIAIAALFVACQPPTVAKDGGLAISVGIVDLNVTDTDIKAAELILKNRISAVCKSNPSVVYDSISRSFRVELPKEQDLLKFDTLLFTCGRFETFETYELSELHDNLHYANKVCAERQSVIPADTMLAANPLFSVLMLQYVEGSPQKGPVLGYCKVSDTATVNAILNQSYVAAIFPRDVKFMWADERNLMMALIAIRGYNHSPGIDNSVLENVSARSGSYGYEVELSFKPQFHKLWARVTANNVDRSLAIVIDGKVYSYPRVNDEITGGRSIISANFSEYQANILAAVLNNGILPVSLKILTVARVEPK